MLCYLFPADSLRAAEYFFLEIKHPLYIFKKLITCSICDKTHFTQIKELPECSRTQHMLLRVNSCHCWHLLTKRTTNAADNIGNNFRIPFKKHFKGALSSKTELGNIREEFVFGKIHVRSHAEAVSSASGA